ncbi:hypothetical protein SCALM49S_10269 [Streptomyces californicus]
MKTRPMPNSRWSSASSATTWACVVTSRAETGSSQTISFGSAARARAIPTRWRCPPLNSCG